MKQKKDILWNFRASDDLIERLNRASVATDRPAAQIVREAIREKLDQLAAEFPQIDTAPPQQAPAAS
jgi:predicted DNA-binding protein